MAHRQGLLPSILVYDGGTYSHWHMATRKKAPEPADDGFMLRQHKPEQGSLFPTDDVVIPSSIEKFRKPVAAIHAIPTKLEHAQTLNGRRLFDAIMVAVQLDFRRRGDEYLKRVINDRVSPLFDLRISDLVRLAKIPGKNYKRVYDELDMLFETIFQWNMIGEDHSVEYKMKAHFLSSFGRGEGLKKGMIRFSIDPGILQIILEPSVWASLALKPTEDLATSPSYALYQNCFRYITTTHKVTPDWPVETWVDLLVGPSRYVAEVKGVGRRCKDYGDFKRRVLLNAIERVNEVEALNYTLELKETRSGLRVSRLQFRLIPKQQASLGIPIVWPREVLDVLEKLGFTDAEVEDLGQKYSNEVVADSLVQLRAASERLRAAGRRITSVKAYFKGILENIAAGAAVDQLDIDGIERETRQQEAERQAQERRQRLEDAFAQHVAAVFAERFFELDEAVRQPLLDAFTASAAGAKAQLLLSKGWSPSNKGAMSLLRGWMGTERAELLGSLLPNPEDQNVEGFMAWRADQLST